MKHSPNNIVRKHFLIDHKGADNVLRTTTLNIELLHLNLK